MSHTPGPWIVVDENETRCTVRGTQDDAFVADCCDGFYNDDGDYIRAYSVEANARLIAAAPDLLAALQKLLDHGIADASVMDSARAAIAKATGADK